MKSRQKKKSPQPKQTARWSLIKPLKTSYRKLWSSVNRGKARESPAEAGPALGDEWTDHLFGPFHFWLYLSFCHHSTKALKIVKKKNDAIDHIFRSYKEPQFQMLLLEWSKHCWTDSVSVGMSLPLLATTRQLLFTLDGWMPCSPAHSSRESKDNSHCIFGPMYLGIFLLCASYSWTTGGEGNGREGAGRDHWVVRAAHTVCELESPRHLYFAHSPSVSEAIVATHTEAEESNIALHISRMV